MALRFIVLFTIFSFRSYSQCGTAAINEWFQFFDPAYGISDMALYSAEHTDQNFQNGCVVQTFGDYLIKTGTFRFNGVPKIFYTTPCLASFDSSFIYNSNNGLFSYQIDFNDQSLSSGSAITVDNTGKIYVAGSTISEDFSSSKALFMANNGMHQFGNGYFPETWDTTISLGPYTGGIGIGADNNGNVYLLGGYRDTSTSENKSFIAKFSNLFTPFAHFEGVWTLNAGINTPEIENSLYLYDIKIQSDGKPVMVGGYFNENSGEEVRMLAIRLDTNMEYDHTFGNNGVVMLHPSSNPTRDISIALALDLQPDGKIVLAGTSGFHESEEYSFTTIRLNSNGTLDNSFGQNGYAIHQMYLPTQPQNYYPDEFESYIAKTIKVLPNGNIVVGGGFLYISGLEDIPTFSSGMDTYGGHAAVLLLNPLGQIITEGPVPVGFENFEHLSRLYSPNTTGNYPDPYNPDLRDIQFMLNDIELIDDWNGTDIYNISGCGTHQFYNSSLDLSTTMGFNWCISYDFGNIVTSFEESRYNKSKSINISPNPSDGKIQLEENNISEGEMIIIKDVLGETKLKIRFKLKNLDLSCLKSGIYFLMTEDGNFGKVVIK